MLSWDSGQLVKTIDDLTRDIESSPECTQAYLSRGIAYSKLHEWEKALADYNRVIELEPTNPYAFSNRGYVFAEMEKWDIAIVEFSKSLNLLKLADTYVKRATAYGRSDMRQEAQNDLIQAMRMDPSDRIVFFASGLYHQWERNYEAAVRFYDRCIQGSSEEIQSYWYRAECLAKLGMNEDAMQSYRDYIERENPRATKWIEAARRMIAKLEQV